MVVPNSHNDMPLDNISTGLSTIENSSQLDNYVACVRRKPPQHGRDMFVHVMHVIRRDFTIFHEYVLVSQCIYIYLHLNVHID